MYVIPELRLNDFQLVPIPSAKDLFRRFGASQPAKVSGDSSNLDEPVNRYERLNKFDAVSAAQQIRMEDLPTE